MINEECVHGLTTMTCSSCRHPYRPPEKPTVEAIFTARYPGQCNECNLPIVVGAWIAKLSNESYVHERCA
jgi:hypothetical protein